MDYDSESVLTQIPPSLRRKLSDFLDNSENILGDIDSTFHALGMNVIFPLDVLILSPGIGAILSEDDFGEHVPMGSQDFLPYEGMSRYRIENKQGTITLTGSYDEDDFPREFEYEFDRSIRNPQKLREIIIEEFPSLDIEGDPIFCAVYCSRGYCDILGVYQKGMSGIDASDVVAAADSVDLISRSIHETAYNLSKFRVTVHSSVYDRISDENISIPASFLGKDSGLEHPMCVTLSDRICKEIGVVNGLQIAIFRDSNFLYFTATAPELITSILRIKFQDATNSNDRITGDSLRNAFSKSMAINRAKDGVSETSFKRLRRSWRISEDPGSRIGVGLLFATLNAIFEDDTGRGEKWKLKILSSNALLFQKLAPAMVHLCLARFDPSMRGEIKVVEGNKRGKSQRKLSAKKHARYYNWGHDKIRYIVPSVEGSRSKHWVNHHVRRMKISNPKTIQYYKRRKFPLNTIGDDIYGFRVIKGHYRGIGGLEDDFDYKFGKTPTYYSQKAIAWLRSVENSQDISIQNAEKGGELRIPIGETFIQVDGYCRSTNTVFEFHGDVYHGNPRKFDSSDLCHPFDKEITAGELYHKTTQREELIRSLGFNLVVMWEDEWDLKSEKKLEFSLGAPLSRA